MKVRKTLNDQDWATTRGAQSLDEAVARMRKANYRVYVILAPAGGYYTTSVRPRLYQGIVVACG